MRIAAQLFETSNLRLFRSEIDEEAAHHDVMRWPRAGPFNTTNSAAEQGSGRSTRR
jgi:hypothetical protein